MGVNENLLSAVRAALRSTGPHRLFRSGRLEGLLPDRSSASSAAAKAAIEGGLLEVVRTEAKGKAVVEWVRATAKAAGWLYDNDSPASVLRELRAEVGLLSDMLLRLESLTERCDAAIRRAEAVRVGTGWESEALLHLDRRKSLTDSPCPLSELFDASGPTDMTDFLCGVRRLYDLRQLELVAAETDRPEFSVVVEGAVCSAAVRR